MEWVPLNDYEDGMNQVDKPRKLTEKEINFIVNQIPMAPSADGISSQISQNSTIRWLKASLRNKYIAPSSLDDTVNEIKRQHEKSLITPGTSAGITSAETIGATTTQMTLNSVIGSTKLLICCSNGKDFCEGKIIKIGEWIDKLLEENQESIVHIPENRTQYLELEEPVHINTVDENGKVSWEKLTAVTRHLPVGDLISIKTKSGRSVVVTQSKSLLVWDGDKLVHKNGSDVHIGDLVPVICKTMRPPKVASKEPNKNIFSANEIVLQELKEHFRNCTIDFCDGTVSLLLKSEDDMLGIEHMCNRFEVFGFHLYDELNKIYTLRYNISENVLFWEDIIGRKNLDKVNMERALKSSFTKKGDIFLDSVLNIERMKAPEYVYDVTVPSTTNFTLWNGLGVADTFHTSGSAKTAFTGIKEMSKLIFSRKKIDDESSTIYFTNKRATFEEVLDSRRYIVGSVVSDFVDKIEINNPDNLSKFWWHDSSRILLGKDIPQVKYIIRLHLNIAEMFKHKVSLVNIANSLEKEVPPAIIAIYGPMSDAIIDIYPVPSLIKEGLKKCETTKKANIPDEFAHQAYLKLCVEPELKNIRIKGVSGIRQLYPIVSPVWRMVLSEEKITESDGALYSNLLNAVGPEKIKRCWSLILNNDVMNMTGLTKENLVRLCNLAGVNVLGPQELPDILIAIMPYDAYSLYDGTKVYFDPQSGKYYSKLNNDDIVSFNDILYREVETKSIDGGSDENWIEKGEYWIEKRGNGNIVRHPKENLILIDNVLYLKLVLENIQTHNGEVYQQILNPADEVKDTRPNDYITAVIAAEKDRIKTEENRLTKEMLKYAETLDPVDAKILKRKPIIVPRTELLQAAEFVIAETDGSNLKELLSLPMVDNRRTTCNNMFTIKEVLGIEAARTFLIRAFYNTISNTGSYVHPANIMLIAEIMTNKGTPYGATFSALSRLTGFFTVATFERAGTIFTTSAAHHSTERIENVSSSVAVGARMYIGSGYSDIGQVITVNNQPKIILNDDVFDGFKEDDNYNYQQRPDSLDFSDTFDQLEELNADGGFDFAGEEETTLLTAFNPRETRNETQQSTSTTSATKSLIDVLAFIKQGKATDSPSEKESEEAETESETRKEQPQIMSTGLIPFEFNLQPTEEFSADLLELLNPYLSDEVLSQKIDLPSQPVEPFPSREKYDTEEKYLEAKTSLENYRDDTLVRINEQQSQDVPMINIEELMKAMSEF